GPPVVEMPESPSVACIEALHLRAEAMYGAGLATGGQRSVGADDGAPAALGIGQHLAGLHETALHERVEGDARLRLLARHDGQFGLAKWLDPGNAGGSRVDVILLTLDADEVAAKALCHRAGRPGAEERIEDDVAGLRGRHDDAREQSFRLLGRMHLLAVIALQALATRAD